MHQRNKDKGRATAYDHIIKYTGLFGGVQGIGLLASVVRNKLVAVILGPSGLGLISLYNTALTLLGNATNLGISFSAVRHISELSGRGDNRQMMHYIMVVRSWSMATAILGILICALVSPFLSWSYFNDYSHWQSFVWLAPIVGLTALTGGELAILKGMHRLKQVALQSIVVSFGTLFTSIPFYFAWGEDGIVPALLLTALLTLCSVLWFSFRDYPFRFRLITRRLFAQGMGMVRLGMAFTLAGILGSGVEFIIRVFMQQFGSTADVGLYNAGYTLTVTYASMIFVAMETDYFPRLSAVNHDVSRSNEIVNRQMEVSVLLITPLLVVFLIGLPVILPLLYAQSFMPVIEMAQWAVFSMFLRAATLPVAYMSLAKGCSKIYLFTEAVYDVVAVLLIVCGYMFVGLKGTGMALSFAALIDLLLVWLTCRKMYDFHIDSRAIRMLFIQLPFVVIAFCVARSLNGMAYWLSGCFVVLLSWAVSLHIFYKETTLIQKIKERFNRKNKA